jgi:phosphatidylglycerophosphatase A
METEDNQCVVIDEVVGLGVTAWMIPQESLWGWVGAFVVFRLFDIWKPFPIRWIDHWSHQQTKRRPPHEAYWWSGFGVMADDLLAGVYGLIVCVIAAHFWTAL